MVEGAEYHHRWQRQECNRDDNFLHCSGFRHWPGMHTPLKGCRVLQTQVDARDTRREGKDGNKNPCLPIIKRPRWQKQHQPKHYKSNKSSTYCLKACFHDRFSLFSSRVLLAHSLANWTWRPCCNPVRQRSLDLP